MTLCEMLIKKIGQDIYDQYKGVEAYGYTPDAADYEVQKVYEHNYQKQRDYVLIHHVDVLDGFHVSTAHSERYCETLDEIDPQILSPLDKFKIRRDLYDEQDMNYYRVEEGKTTRIDCAEADEDYDPNNTCIAYASRPDEAEELAAMYDSGEIQADNVYCQVCGKSHAALRITE